MERFRINSKRDNRHRLFQALREQHFAHRIAAAMSGGNPPESTLLEPVERRRIIMKNVLASLHYDGGLRRKPLAQSEHLGAGYAVRLMMELNQRWLMLAQRGDNRSRVISKQLNVL